MSSLSALKRSHEGTAVLRVYETAGQATPGVQVRLPEGTEWVREVDLMEDPIAELAVTRGRRRVRPEALRDQDAAVPAAWLQAQDA